ncbi:uncharacterized protein [Rutidosis leptorrhynchoides]|uniref:uncharacterized protein n=1 Tax=Rutidosis leptorrhynchoides TaxID=125765 RepID=UPI003A994991
MVAPDPAPPEEIKNFFQGHRFMENIRAYNQMFSMTSFGAWIDESINDGSGPYVFKISGQLYHWIGSLCLPKWCMPRFLQLYVYDTKHEVHNIMSHFGGEESDRLSSDVVARLIVLLDTHNELVKLFRTTLEKCLENTLPSFRICLFNVGGSRQNDLPVSNSIGAIVSDSGPKSGSDYDVIIECKVGTPQRVNKLHPHYMSLQYPLLFIYGQRGFHIDMKLRRVPGRRVRNNDKLTMNMFYSFQLHKRLNLYSLLMRSGILFQQYVVTAYCRWSEMTRYMANYPGLTTIDRADVICRIFQMRVNQFEKFVKIDQPLGYLHGVLYTIEIQKRGLPHYHTLLWAFPPPGGDPCGYKVVTELMMHGTYGLANPSSPYMDGEPLQSCWRILNFPIHHHEPPVQKLVAHLEHMQTMTFRDNQSLQSVISNPAGKKMTLTEWISYNRSSFDGRNLAYLDFLLSYSWESNHKLWKRRKVTTKFTIGRLSYMHPSAREVFYLRMLLCHQKGSTYFIYLQTVNNNYYPIYHLACEAMCLLGDDKEWGKTLDEASATATAAQLRTLFVHILLYCEVGNPLQL